MKAYKNFLKELKKLDIKVVEYFYLDGFGWIKAKDLDNVPKNVKKTFYWELGTLNENRLKELQSDAVSELALLDNDQLERQLKRLDLLNEFKTFHNFIKGFYVKAVDNTYNGLDELDFKLLLERCFYVEIPDKGNINVEFLTELINQVYFKSSLLDGLKHQTTNLLPMHDQGNVNDYLENDAEHNNLTPQQSEKPKPELNKIWLSEPKISVQNLLTLGIEKGIWNDEYQIITAKGSLYGTGKTMLGSLFIALKGFAVSENIDYKEAGKVFCSFFNIPINERTKEPYKAFSSGNEKLIRELKRAFNIK